MTTACKNKKLVITGRFVSEAKDLDRINMRSSILIALFFLSGVDCQEQQDYCQASRFKWSYLSIYLSICGLNAAYKKPTTVKVILNEACHS